MDYLVDAEGFDRPQLRWMMIHRPSGDPAELRDWLLRSPWMAGWMVRDLSTDAYELCILNPFYPWRYDGEWKCRGGQLEEIPVSVAWLQGNGLDTPCTVGDDVDSLDGLLSDSSR
jgi:hypothetical protein